MSTTTVINSNWPKYNNEIKWCLEDVLGLKEYHLNVIYCALFTCTGKFLQPNTIQVDQRLLKDEHFIQTLFHEIRHYYQHETNMFDFVSEGEKIKSVIESDKIFTDEYDEHFMDWDHIWKKYKIWYFNLPWEIDARKFTDETYDKYCKHPSFKV